MDPRIELQQGDITRLAVDAVVNAANSSLLGGGGVDGAIHRAGGPAILEECRRIRDRRGGCPAGEAVITTAGRLPARHVIHTVGPVWNGGRNNEEQLLANAYRNSLRLAAQNEIRTIAFPNISTGIYRFPKDRAAAIAVAAAEAFLSGDAWMERVIFVCFDEENYQLYRALLDPSGLAL
jgi:O-acetyl-ADP-ribose deacetylase (regulator of RNase III)